MEPNGQRDCAQEQQSYTSLARGCALPPFSPLRPETLAVLLRLADGEAPAEPTALSLAVVVQIWFIFFGPEASTELAQAGRSGFYRALAALTLGEASPPPSPAEEDRLRVALERKHGRSSRQRPGLIQRFRDTLSRC